MRGVHSLEILIRTEEHDPIVVGYVGFQSLKALNTVVQGGVCGVELKGLVCANHGALPSTIVRIVINVEHIVS